MNHQSQITSCIIGDDVVGEADNVGYIKYLLYDGQGSVRHHSNSSGNLIAYSGCDTFASNHQGLKSLVFFVV